MRYGADNTEEVVSADPIMASTALPTPWASPEFPAPIHTTVVDGEGQSCARLRGSTLSEDRIEMLNCLLDHKAHAQSFQILEAPILQLSIRLLRRSTEKIRQWLGVVKSEKRRKSSRDEDLKCVAVALAQLVMKKGEKPGKFLLPHGIILLRGWLCIFMEDNP